MTRSLLTAAALVIAGAASSGELTLQELASIERDEQKAVDQVEELHGNKKPQQMPPEERVEIIHQRQEASRRAFEEHGADPKEVAHRQMRLSPAEREQVDVEKQRLDQDERDLKAKEAAAAHSAGEAEVVQGINEQHPAEVYSDPDSIQVDRPDDGAEPAPQEKPAKSRRGR